MTIVVFVAGELDGHRFKKICLPTINRFADESCHKLVVVSPTEIEVDSHLDSRVITDDKILKKYFRKQNVSRGNTWKYQMKLKLLIHKYVETEWYVIFDSDCYMSRGCELKDYFLPDSKIAKVNIVDYPLHVEWQISAEQFLSLPRPNKFCGVTPMIMNTAVVRHLCEEFHKELSVRGPN